MKRLLAVLMCLALFVPCALAEEETPTYTSGYFTYILLEDDTAQITAFDGENFSDTALTVPE